MSKCMLHAIIIIVVQGSHLKKQTNNHYSSDGKESARNAGGWEDPLEKGMATHSSILA